METNQAAILHDGYLIDPDTGEVLGLVDFEHGAMYIRDKEDITQYAYFLPTFGAGGEICLLTDCDNIQAVPEDVSREFAIRYLLEAAGRVNREKAERPIHAVAGLDPTDWK